MHVSNYLYCLILIFTLGYFCEISATILVPVQGVSNCTIVPSKGRSIKYINWPFRLSCDHLTTEDWLRAYGVDVSRDGILPCYVRNPQDRIISPETPISLNSTTPRLTIYTVYQVLNSTHCLSNDIVVELRHLPNRTCVDDVTYAGEHNINVELVKSHIGGPEITLECQPAQNAGPATVYPPFTSGSNIQTKWYRSKVNRTSQVGCATRIISSDVCSPIITSAISNNRKFLLSERTDRPKALKIFGYNFYDPGVYSCEVNY
uniref:Ig-like domain-containing protein n=1 Tax=Ciona savignyi TaxID=51511 RepID=H2Z5X2_CIOSA